MLVIGVVLGVAGGLAGAAAYAGRPAVARADRGAPRRRRRRITDEVEHRPRLAQLLGQPPRPGRADRSRPHRRPGLHRSAAPSASALLLDDGADPPGPGRLGPRLRPLRGRRTPPSVSTTFLRDVSQLAGYQGVRGHRHRAGRRRVAAAPVGRAGRRSWCSRSAASSPSPSWSRASSVASRPDILHLTGFSGSSFPSGHATAAAAMFMTAALLLGRRRTHPHQGGAGRRWRSAWPWRWRRPACCSACTGSPTCSPGCCSGGPGSRSAPSPSAAGSCASAPRSSRPRPSPTAVVDQADEVPGGDRPAAGVSNAF